jgi:hypothetical protein
LLAGKIEGVNPQQTGLRIEQREAGVVMMNDALESVDDAAEKFGEFAAGDQEIVDFENNLEAVALARELRLISLGRCRIERIVNGYSHLASNALHELHLGVRDLLRHHAAEAHRAEPALRGGERKNRHGTNVVFAKAPHKVWESRFFVDIDDDERLLRLPNPAGRIALDRRFRASHLFRGDMGFENVKAHDVADGIVEDKAKEVEFDNRMEPAGEVVEKRREIALLGDGLADFEQGFELTPGVFERGGKRHFRRRDHGIRHRGRIASGLAEAQPEGQSLFVLVRRFPRDGTIRVKTRPCRKFLGINWVAF